MRRPAKSSEGGAASLRDRSARASADADGTGGARLSILDPAYVLGVLRVRESDLASFGYRSVEAFYRAEGVRRGVPPCAVFDPVFVLAATTGLPPAAALDDPGAVLQAALAAYLEAAEEGRPPSPSAAFDEAFVRATVPSLAAAVREKRAASALAAWLDAGKPAIGTTASGLHRFPEAMPHPWWQRERAAAALRGGRRATPARLTEEAVQRVRAADPPALAVSIEPGIPEEARAGETVTLVAQGFACSPGGRILAADLLLGDAVLASEPFQAFPRAEAFARATTLVDAPSQLFGGFAVAWTGAAPAPGDHTVTLRLRIGRGAGEPGGERVVGLGTLPVRPRSARRRRVGGAPLVAIALAAFEPREELLDAQLQSIRAQSLPDWQLTISDETVSDAARALIARMVRGDPRMTLHHGPRLGVVGNFERALRAVDPRAPFVALSDQDDRWHVDKLARLAHRMDDGVTLAHGAMRLVDAAGDPLPGGVTARDAAPTLADLIAENQVTGAAALIRADVVRAALPLPRLGGLYHDHWLALVAGSLGRVVFEPSVVQDYVQHGANVIGEDPARDRAAAERLARESEGFAGLLAVAMNTSDVDVEAAEGALLPAAFGVVPAALLRTVALGALQRRRRGGGAAGSPCTDGLPAVGALSLGELAAVAEALGATTDRTRPGRIGVAAWLDTGLAAIAAVAAKPGLAAAVAAAHHRRALAAATVPAPVRRRRPRSGGEASG